VFQFEPSRRILADCFVEVSALSVSSERIIRTISERLTVIPPVKYQYSYLIAPLFSYKVIK
jgi:hypothetical protein